MIWILKKEIINNKFLSNIIKLIEDKRIFLFYNKDYIFNDLNIFDIILKKRDMVWWDY